MTLVREGWIEKKGQTFMAGYKKRWLVLYSDKTLKYYEDNYYEILKGSIDISSTSKIQNSSEHSKNWKYGFEIITPNRNWQFSSKSDNDRKQWIKNIQTVMDYTSLKSSSNRMSYNKHKNLKNIAKVAAISNKNNQNQNLNDNDNDIVKSTQQPLLTSHNQNNDIKSTDFEMDDDLPFGAEDNKVNKPIANKSLDFQLKIATNNTNFNKSRKSLSPSKFGNDIKIYDHLNTKSMMTLLNKNITLSVALHNKNKQENKENDSRFNWKIYSAKLNDNYNLNDNEISCYCGGVLKLKTFDEEQGIINCELCGQHKIFNNDEYFECDLGQHDMHLNGYKLCCYDYYHYLCKKYYNPSIDSYRRIGIRVNIIRISDIDTSTHSFRCKFVIKHSWKPTHEEVELFNDKAYDFEPYWVPLFEFPDIVCIHDSGFRLTHWGTEYTILRCGESNNESITSIPYIICGEYYIDATFSEIFELNNFPLDCQDLTIRILSQQYTSICRWNIPFQGDYILQCCTNIIPDDWLLHQPQFEIINVNIGPICEYSQLNISIKLERIYLTYGVKIVLFMFLLSLMSLCGFVIDDGTGYGGGDRITYLMILLLTSVTFQFIIKTDLPKISSFTLMDKYILFAYLLIFSVLIETAIIIKFDNINDEIDIYFSYIFCAIFIIIQIFFIILAKKARIYELRKLNHAYSDTNKYCNKKRNALKLMKLRKHGERRMVV